jgi:hypothetical protein
MRSDTGGGQVHCDGESQVHTSCQAALERVAWEVFLAHQGSCFRNGFRMVQQIVISEHVDSVVDSLDPPAASVEPEREPESEMDIMEALRRRWQAEMEEKEREAAAVAARSRQREVSAVVIAEEEAQRREAVERSQREAAALKQLRRQQAQAEGPKPAVACIGALLTVCTQWVHRACVTCVSDTSAHSRWWVASNANHTNIV